MQPGLSGNISKKNILDEPNKIFDQQNLFEADYIGHCGSDCLGAFGLANFKNNDQPR